jgi:thiosulfate/3-mercaptopyruvate sulfurtransferase
VVESQSTAPPLISADRLGSLLGAPGVVILDVSWYLPSAGRDADAEYVTAHIPGAIRLRLDDLTDPADARPHMLPSPQRFAEMCEAHGIGPRHALVVYDGSGVNLSAARAWWTFRVFGHRSVSVLDGGILAWASATRPIQVGAQRRPRTGYPVPTRDERLVVDRAAIDRIVAGADEGQLVDCRPAARFRGEVDEPRPNVARGHITGSANLPYDAFTDPATGLLHRVPRLKALFAERGLDLGRRIVASCGSGTSACVLALAVEVIRASEPGAVGPPVAIYDGSWAEYGLRDDEG